MTAPVIYEVAVEGREQCKRLLDAFRMGRVTAFAKPDGGVRGIVFGDLVEKAHRVDPLPGNWQTVHCGKTPTSALKTRAHRVCDSHSPEDAMDAHHCFESIGAFDLVS